MFSQYYPTEQKNSIGKVFVQNIQFSILYFYTTKICFSPVSPWLFLLQSGFLLSHLTFCASHCSFNPHIVSACFHSPFFFLLPPASLFWTSSVPLCSEAENPPYSLLLSRRFPPLCKPWSPVWKISSGNRILPPESPVPFSYNSLIQNFFLPLLFFLAKCVILKTRTNVRIGAPWKFPEHESWSFAVSSFYFIPLVQFYKEVPLLRRNTHEHLSLL